MLSITNVGKLLLYLSKPDRKIQDENDQKQNKEINQKRESLKLKLSNEPKPAGTDLTMEERQEERQMYRRAMNFVNVGEHY